MIRKLTAIALKSGVVGFLLFIFLFINAILDSPPSSVGFIWQEINNVLRDPETQWMVFLCLGIYFVAFVFLRSRAASFFWRTTNPNLWLTCTLFIGAVVYAFHYSPSTQALIFLAGTVLGQGAAFWAEFDGRRQKAAGINRLGILVISVMTLLLTLASIWKTNPSQTFKYQEHIRWSGPWDNPNIFGLLMGTGITLAAGQLIQSLKFVVQSQKQLLGKYARVVLCVLAIVLLIRGLIHSYSRGAWIATILGLSYLGWHLVRSPQSGVQRILWLKRNWLPACVVLLSTVVLCFWQFRETEWRPAHRAFSAVNAADFSWRNRIAAWEGALQITAEHPWLGAGWEKPEPLYENYYLPPKLTERLAIQMNDYFMLGATIGIPALFCFGMYLWLTLNQNPESRIQNPEMQQSIWLQTICRAGAIVLLVGFWFDGGLFKLATTTTFWVLLELGAVRNYEAA
jgi:hypothetical protein